MSRRQQITKSLEITCDGCSKVVSRDKAFSGYEFECCSIRCLNPLRQQRQSEQRRLEEERDAKRSRHGAFTLHGGGCY